MPNLDEIKAQIQSIDGTQRLLGRREIKQLPTILWEDEIVEALVQGTFNSNLGILVATNKRLLFVDKKLVGIKVEDFPYDKISSLKYETGMIYGKIVVYASGNRAEIKNVAPKNLIKEFAEYVRARSTSISTHAGQNKPASTDDDDVVNKLEKLARLYKADILNKQEFEAQKKKLLEA